MSEAPVIDPTYRPLGMETDLGNPNFAGARNPDDLLWVNFSMKAIQDNFKSAEQSRPIFKDELWIEIRIPGRNDLTIERPAIENDKFRFPRHWAFFKQTHGTEGQNVGTPLTQWPQLRPSQVEELRALKFYTVDQVAFASDEQIGRVGMIAGMAPFAFRERAKLYLETAKDNAAAVRQSEEIKKRDEELSALKKAQQEANEQHAKEMAEMRETLAALSRQQIAQAPRRGRPPKNAQVQPDATPPLEG